MKMSRIGILSLIAISILATTGCISGVLARKNVVDGAKAYQDRKYEKAESLFRNAMAWDKNQPNAKLFLARTLHSQFASDRKLVPKADEAIAVYKEVLTAKPDDDASFKAVANLLETLLRKDELQKWLEDRAANESVPGPQRADAYTSLASKQYSCANDISDIEPVKKTVEKAGKLEFVFTKPTTAGDFDKLKGCVAKGTELIDKAVALNDSSDSIWSYKTSLLVQQSRIAEMEGNADGKAKFKAEADTAKARFQELAEARRKKEEEEIEKKKAEEEKKTKK
jgi:tetratricopeptide (TPR) repeat protein